MSNPEQRTAFKATDGRYELHSEKTHGLVQFASRRGTRLTLAELHGGNEEGVYIVYNVGDYLNISPYDATEKVRTAAGMHPPAEQRMLRQHDVQGPCNAASPCQGGPPRRSL
jgi:hypothetical protein